MIAPNLQAVPPPHLLVVDDDPAVRNVLAQLLHRLGGYRVTTAASGTEALAQLAAAPDIELVVSDLAMPGMSGVDLLAAMPRGIGSKLPLPPVAIVSGHADGPRRQRCLNLGAVAVMAKPVAPDDLLQMVRRALLRTDPAAK